MPAADESAVWDDTAAISRSWDRVVDDYKVFHAVRARGGTVDDLPAFPQQGTRPDGLSETAGGSTSHAAGKDEDSEEPEHPEAASPGHEDTAAGETQVGGESGAPNPGLLPPQAVLKDADENLKKLLMSWYYAGYYTGLYEGQQQAQQQAQQQTQQTQQAQPQTMAETDETDEPVHNDGPGDE